MSHLRHVAIVVVYTEDENKLPEGLHVSVIAPMRWYKAVKFIIKEKEEHPDFDYMIVPLYKPEDDEG